MRNEHLAAGTYDFRATTLNRVGNALFEAGQLDDAIIVLKANVGFFPDSAATYLTLGQVYEKKGDLPAAVDHVNKAATLDPSNQFTLQTLEKLKAKLPKH